MRLAHPFETMDLDQFDNPAKTRPGIGRESFDLILNKGIEHFNDSRHLSIVLHFCNTNIDAGRA